MRRHSAGHLRLGEVKTTAEVQQRTLAYLSAVALAAHEAVGVVALAAGSAGEGSAHKHGRGQYRGYLAVLIPI